jgi:hypothetical protein
MFFGIFPAISPAICPNTLPNIRHNIESLAVRRLQYIFWYLPCHLPHKIGPQTTHALGAGQLTLNS